MAVQGEIVRPRTANHNLKPLCGQINRHPDLAGHDPHITTRTAVNHGIRRVKDQNIIPGTAG
ncbi:hypothetical protein [Profundibacter amoris]|uniref:hypothetical protein n=1 Tax=Profundibacter amoris TaxID=2171755 RepID=UPI0013C36376|nr:hypothetical protein [Profundibacter amoris]